MRWCRPLLVTVVAGCVAGACGLEPVGAPAVAEPTGTASAGPARTAAGPGPAVLTPRPVDAPSSPTWARPRPPTPPSEPGPAAEPRPQPAPQPPPPEAAPPATPFELVVEHVAVRPMGNTAILHGSGQPPSTEAAGPAVRAAAAALRGYLDAQFVDERTRFSAAPVERLLSPAALSAASDTDRAGLGQVDLPVEHTLTGPATAVASVLFDGPVAYAVTLEFDARLRLTFDDGAEGPARQHGSVLLVPGDHGWRAEAVSVTLELPGHAGGGGPPR